jgi:hypothetical protein
VIRNGRGASPNRPSRSIRSRNCPRPRRAKLAAQFKRARTPIEVREKVAFQLDPEKGKPDPALFESPKDFKKAATLKDVLPSDPFLDDDD